MSAPTNPAGPRLVIDTDPGIDDAVALLVALGAAAAQARLVAVTTVFGNAPLPVTTGNALRVLALAGREDVPVAAGAARPLVHPRRADERSTDGAGHWHHDDGLGGRAADLPAPAGGPDPRGAVQLLADVLRAPGDPVVIAAIGPLTNIALLLGGYPELAGRIGRLVVMGGGLAGGNSTAAGEFNVWSDPEAARRVLVEESVPTTLVPLDVTMRCAVDPGWVARLAASGPVGETIGGVLAHYRRRYREFTGVDRVPLHDAVAVLEACRPGTLATTPLSLEVVCDQGPARGALIADRRGPGSRPTDPDARLVDVALPDVLSADAVTALHEAVLTRLTAVPGPAPPRR